ncbi:helix-turn-helix transcriptional regulator [Flavobacterium zhairuonense]|uniref:helix-turn-helix domain-containing protein n=1 Tax=Flavobacterium zhairuonense TaxID=2493631 RepID=UPI001044063C|nr:AraC family transcriptional regulator [Flavobacterium zhairuonense]KAF2518227.1 helix-turn-helix transcriptional regulator [Flavobacterium zhairuonense]
MLQQTLKKWLNQFKQYFFTYSNGFYHLPYSSKTPEDLVESLANYPFMKHDRIKQSVYANTPFCSGGFNYQKLEEGLWVIYSKMRYKTNVAFDLIYDDPAEMKIEDKGYYMLSLNNVTSQPIIDLKICEKQLCFANYSWTFFKPKERNCDVNFKGANNKYITLYFNEEWLQKNLLQNSLFSEAGLDKFITSDQPYIAWPVDEKDELVKNFGIFDEVMNMNNEASHIDFLQFKLCTLNLIFGFLRTCRDQQVFEKHFAIDYEDKFSINKVENYLTSNLYDKFPGIDFLAEKFKISESKLKSEFKQFFGKPIYKYFQEKQMMLAKELIIENKLLIKEISYKFGYENTSKFTAAFKKYHDILPSELQKQEFDVAI